MASTGSKSVSLFSLIFVAACSSASGDWPNLSDPIPNASERERVVERAEPTPLYAPEAPDRDNPLTQSVAIKLLTTVRAEVKRAKETYIASKGAIAREKGEEKEIAWHEAQLKLTRLSHNADRLDSITYADQLKAENVWQQAQNLQAMTDSYVAAERQALSKLKP